MSANPLFINSLNYLPDLKQVLVNTLENFISKFIEFVPNLVVALIIIAAGVIIGKIAAKITDRVLNGIGFNKLGDKINEIDSFKKFNLDIKLSRLVGQMIYYFTLLIFIIAAADALGVPAISNMVMMLVEFIPKVIAAALMILFGILIADALRKFIAELCASFNIAAGKLISSAVFFLLVVIVIIAALGQTGINTDLLEFVFSLIIGGIVLAFSIGYGLASREILLNILSSFYSRNRYKIGQIIEVDGVKGEIVDMDNTTIRLKSGDQITILPLRVLQTQKIIVYS